MSASTVISTKEEDFRKGIGFNVELPRNVLTAIFACPECNWPLVSSRFTDHDVQIESHDLVFELTCGQCKWTGAVLGRDMVNCMVDDWQGRKVRRQRTTDAVA